MKFIGALAVYLLFALLLGWGILLTVRGEPWLLIVGILTYVLLVAKIGCLPPKPNH